MSRVYALGIAVLDLVFDGPAIPSAATKYRAERLTRTIGGSATNAAIAIARLGGAVSLAARIGDDPAGQEIETALSALGIDTSTLLRHPGAQSSTSAVMRSADGERQIINFRGKGLTEDTSAIALPPGTAAVLADTRWPAGMSAALSAARDSGLPGIVDVDTPLDACDFSAATHLAFARHALSAFSGTEEIGDGLRRAAQETGAWVCVTDGARGTFALEGGDTRHIPAPQVRTVDTLGAGDVWHGAFALGLAENMPPLMACRFANVAAALKCARFGIAQATPDRSDVEKHLREAPQ